MSRRKFELDPTQAQQAFARYVFEGMSYVDAYRKLGYGAGQSNDILYNNASRMARGRMVKFLLKGLNMQANLGTVMTEQERRERLSEIAREDIHSNKGVPGSCAINRAAGLALPKSCPV